MLIITWVNFGVWSYYVIQILKIGTQLLRYDEFEINSAHALMNKYKYCRYKNYEVIKLN
jgi:hypothetical protein